MDQREIERFRVIGACTKMQTTSWEDEMKLMDGIPYMIDFFQDFFESANGRGTIFDL